MQEQKTELDLRADVFFHRCKKYGSLYHFYPLLRRGICDLDSQTCIELLTQQCLSALLMLLSCNPHISTEKWYSIILQWGQMRFREHK